MKKEHLEKYFHKIREGILNARFTDENNSPIDSDAAIMEIIKLLVGIKSNGRKIMFIGNGGSAAISSHMAQDYSKIGGLRAVCFNDASLITCLANDYSFEQMFEKAVKLYGDAGDVLVAISSSGRSLNILNGAASAKKKGCEVVTLSGFQENNPLSKLGRINIHVPASTYGTVEVAHYLFLHSLLDYIAKIKSRR